MTNSGYSLPSCFEILVNRIGIISKQEKNNFEEPTQKDNYTLVDHLLRAGQSIRPVWLTPALAAGASVYRTRKR